MSRITQHEAILRDLMEGKKLTSLMAWVAYGCNALNSRVSELRKEGYIISDVWISVIGKGGEKKHVKEYFFEPEYIKELKAKKAA